MKKPSQVKFSEKEFSEPLTGVEPMTYQPMASTPVGGSENSCSENFDLRTLLQKLWKFVLMYF